MASLLPLVSLLLCGASPWLPGGAAQFVPPRWPTNQLDLGYSNLARGWYDAQCRRGVANDYCRYVGNTPGSWWSCALAGSPDQYSPLGMFSQDSTSAVPCFQPVLTLWAGKTLGGQLDWGYSNLKRGWYDAQCSGVARDYCRYVGNSPGTWWSCALAGFPGQYTPQGMFTEPTTSAAACFPRLLPRWPTNQLDPGYSNLARGWSDVQGQGAADDYCRFVGNTPGTWWSCALAGAASQTRLSGCSRSRASPPRLPPSKGTPPSSSLL